MRPSHPRRFISASLFVPVLIAGSMSAQEPSPAPADALTIDVQVVDGHGRPVPGITADRFDVEINGRDRQVVSARVIDATTRDVAGPLEGRPVYFLVVDASTFPQPAAADAIQSLTALVGTLPEDALVGMVTFPSGPAVELTTDRSEITTALAGVKGQQQQIHAGSMGVSLSDAVDFASSPDPIEITRQFCGAELSEDNACPQLLQQEVGLLLNNIEAQSRASLGMIADFASRLSAIPGRKVVVLASAGLAVAQRSGGRPDVGNLPTELGRALTQSDAALYTLMLDGLWSSISTDGRRSRNAGRDRDSLGRWLEQFSVSMGGNLVRVQPGQPGEADSRIAMETASYYELTLAREPNDNTSGPQRLRVRVNQRGVDVRARTLVKTN
jgi:VWFA-related protein